MVINTTTPSKAKTTQQALYDLVGEVPVVREKISQSTVDEYMEAREKEEFQEQLDVIFHVLAGVDPGEEIAEDS